MTDDTIAFQNALYAARGKVLYVPRPSNCYLVSSLSLSGEVCKGTRIIGDNRGTAIKFTGSSYGISLSNVAFVGIENLKLWPGDNITDLIYIQGTNLCDFSNFHIGYAANDSNQSTVYSAIHNMEASSVSTGSTYNTFTT